MMDNLKKSFEIFCSTASGSAGSFLGGGDHSNQHFGEEIEEPVG
jgi:hypothetical protein